MRNERLKRMCHTLHCCCDWPSSCRRCAGSEVECCCATHVALLHFSTTATCSIFHITMFLQQSLYQQATHHSTSPFTSDFSMIVRATEKTTVGFHFRPVYPACVIQQYSLDSCSFSLDTLWYLCAVTFFSCVVLNAEQQHNGKPPAAVVHCHESTRLEPRQTR